jgi:hypothetical protein
MKNQSRIALFVLSSIFALIPAAAFPQTPADYSWSATAPNVASASWLPAQIAIFIDTITDAEISSSVRDFHFQDINLDGQLELIAVIDLTGRDYANSLVVVRRSGSSFAVQRVRAATMPPVTDMLRDLDGDGRPEIVVPTPFTPYLGARAPEAIYPAIYGWSGIVLSDHSTAFANYYSTAIVPVLRARLDELQLTDPDSIQTDVAAAAYDKALRLSGLDASAGLIQALAWVTHVDPVHRMIAAAILADIATADALTALKTLQTDADLQVVSYVSVLIASVADLHARSLTINVKPGDGAIASINMRSNGTIPVAVLSTAAFNAPAMIARDTLTFGPTGNESSLSKCNSGGEDVDRDGLPDLVCHFDTHAASFQIGGAVAVLRGKLTNGESVISRAAIRVIP